MANPKPLQPGDRSSEMGRTDSLLTGDRRSQDTAPVQSYEGNQASPQLDSPVSPLWKCGQVAPDKHTAPFDPIHMEGDTSGDGTTIHSIDVYSYGDCYDPKAPTRVREVGSEWSVDTDFDAKKN